jgi:thioesterase domain-containing protein/aryl carrier-like protein
MLGRSHMRPNGLVDRDLWLLAEPHLDAGAFTSPFGSSYLNVVTYRARSMVRYWRAPALVTAVLAAPLPLLPIDTFTASGALSGAAALAAADPEAPAELDEHLQEVAQSFHAAMRPEEYLAHNEQLWDALHDMLAPQAPAPLRRLPYPFRASMLALLSTELPHLVAPTAAGGGAGAGAGEGAGAFGAFNGGGEFGGGGGGGEGAVQGVGGWLAAPPPEGWGAEALEALVLRETRAAVGPEVGADTPLMAAGLDSLALLELVARLRETSGLQLTPQMIVESNTPRTAAARLLVLARAAGGGAARAVPNTPVAPPEQSAAAFSAHGEAAATAPPPAGVLTAPPAEWRLPAALWEWGRGSGVCQLEAARLRASGAVVVGGAAARRRDVPTLFFLPGLPGVCGLELYRLHQNLGAWRVVRLPHTPLGPAALYPDLNPVHPSLQPCAPQVGLPYAALAAQLGDGCTAAALAAALVRCVKLLRPRAGVAVAVAGYSAGALVAAEMASVLEAEGEPVSALVLLDPPDLPPQPAPAGGVAGGTARARLLRAMVERHLTETKLETADLPFDGLVRAALGLWRLADGLAPPRATAPALHVRAAQSRGAAEIFEAAMGPLARGAAEAFERSGTPASAGLAAATHVTVPGKHLSFLSRRGEARRTLRAVGAFLREHAPPPPRTEAEGHGRRATVAAAMLVAMAAGAALRVARARP